MSATRTVGDPIAVDHSLVVSVLGQLGIDDWLDVTEVVVRPHQIRVTRLRRDESYNLIAAGDEAATTTNVIAIRRGES